MKQPLLRHCLGTSLCAAVLLAGCNQAQRRPVYARSYVSNSMGSTAIMPGYNPGTVFTTSAPPESVSAKPAEPLPPAPAAEAQTASEKKMPDELPPATLTASPVKPPETKSAEEKLVDHQEAFPAAYAIPVTGAKEESPRRRSYADITAKPCFSHSPDYSWVQGELIYLHSRNVWRIRYASVDEDDKYGGSLVLTDCGSMTNFLSGQMVKVEGHPADADSQDAPATYKVTRIHPLPH